MEYIKKEELIKGEVYRVEDGNFWMIGIVTLPNNGDNDGSSKRGNATYIASVKKIKVDQSWAYQSNYGRTYRLATSEEKHWLLECIKLNKFISYEEAMKTFIPEYVECLMVTTASMHSKYQGILPILNKIYEVAERSFPEKGAQELAVITKCGVTMYDKYTKPSTKEAYDAQFVVKEPEFVLPKLWHIIITTENYEILSKYFSNNSPHSVLYTKGIMGFYKENKLGHTHTQIKGYDWDFGIEITFEQFKKYVLKEEIVEEKVIEQPMTENKTELEIWLENTKSLNLSLEDLEKYIGSGQTCNFDNIYMKLEGHHSKGRAKILFDKWNNKIIEPLPQFKVIESIETITKVENNEGNQFFIGDVVKTEAGLHFKIIGFKYDENKTKILAIATDNYPEVVKDINDIEHYIEPKDVVKEEFVLPEKWCVKTTLSNKNILQDYLQNNIINYPEYLKTWEVINDRYFHNKGHGYEGGHSSYKIFDGFIEITFEQFKKYVLKEDVKEESLLEKAKRLYPIGTKFINPNDNEECVIKEKGNYFKGNNDNIYHSIANTVFKYEEGLSGCIYINNTWSKIIE